MILGTCNHVYGMNKLSLSPFSRVCVCVCVCMFVCVGKSCKTPSVSGSYGCSKGLSPGQTNYRA